METTAKEKITVQSTINAPVEKVWKLWTVPEHVARWNNASDDWHTPYAMNDLRPGGKFVYRMEARDGSFGFDFNGIYNEVRENELIDFTIADGRRVVIHFTPDGNETRVVETFEAENMNSIELQRTGWQAILDNFKKYTEAAHAH